MIKFFRKIRRKLANENKFVQYSRYAVGEILLVMVGILLALQVNTWNEQRKLKILEIGILQNFKESLQKDLYNLNSNMIVNHKIKTSINVLLDYMEQPLPYQDSLKFHFGNIATGVWRINLNESPFESLKMKDINLISNEDLKQKIMLTYGKLNTTLKIHQGLFYNIIEDASINIFNTRFEGFWESNYETWVIESDDFIGTQTTEVKFEMIPLNYNKLKEDQEFNYFLISLKNRYNWLIELQAKSMKKAIESLNRDIEGELKILKNE